LPIASVSSWEGAHAAVAGVDRAFAVGVVGLWAGDLVPLGLDHAVTS
jgi:hypothetical protein